AWLRERVKGLESALLDQSSVVAGAPRSVGSSATAAPRTGGVPGTPWERTPVRYWLLNYGLLGPLLRLILRPQVEGLHHVPVTGPVILASSPLSFSDSIFTPRSTPRKVTFVAKAEYFTGKGIKGWLTRKFFAGT